MSKFIGCGFLRNYRGMSPVLSEEDPQRSEKYLGISRWLRNCKTAGSEKLEFLTRADRTVLVNPCWDFDRSSTQQGLSQVLRIADKSKVVWPGHLVVRKGGCHDILLPPHLVWQTLFKILIRHKFSNDCLILGFFRLQLLQHSNSFFPSSTAPPKRSTQLRDIYLGKFLTTVVAHQVCHVEDLRCVSLFSGELVWGTRAWNCFFHLRGKSIWVFHASISFGIRYFASTSPCRRDWNLSRLHHSALVCNLLSLSCLVRRIRKKGKVGWETPARRQIRREKLLDTMELDAMTEFVMVGNINLCSLVNIVAFDVWLSLVLDFRRKKGRGWGQLKFSCFCDLKAWELAPWMLQSR